MCWFIFLLNMFYLFYVRYGGKWNFTRSISEGWSYLWGSTYQPERAKSSHGRKSCLSTRRCFGSENKRYKFQTFIMHFSFMSILKSFKKSHIKLARFLILQSVKKKDGSKRNISKLFSSLKKKIHWKYIIIYFSTPLSLKRRIWWLRKKIRNPCYPMRKILILLINSNLKIWTIFFSTRRYEGFFSSIN